MPKQTVQQAIIREVQRNRKKNLGNNNKNKKPNDVDAYNEMTTTNMHQQKRRQRR